jgi:cyclic pyranopterin phosphate synthase
VPVPLDQYARPLGSLRISVTDRCNLRCAYCMPEAEYTWLPREHILHFEEVTRLARVCAALGARRVRLTGGEPLLRRDLPDLVGQLASVPGIEDLALTTNGVLLSPVATALREAGLTRITVSLDTLDAQRFRDLTRSDELGRVRDGLAEAARVFGGVKIDTVVIRGMNDDEIVPLAEEAARLNSEIRFIEYMDVGGATRWSADQVVPRAEILRALGLHFGGLTPIDATRWAPADRYRLPGGQVVGVISSTTQPFCSTCDRSRLTADGLFLLCLYAIQGLDLRAMLRGGVSDEAIATAVAAAWNARTDRGAEDRVAEYHRAPLVSLSSLKRDPHLEMHTRGG